MRADHASVRGYVAGRLTRVRGNPRTGKLHGFEPSNIEQRRCAEGDREAVSRRRSPGAACSTVANCVTLLLCVWPASAKGVCSGGARGPPEAPCAARRGGLRRSQSRSETEYGPSE